MMVWFDAFTQNVDRTPRNPNLLVWHRKLYPIDHGAASLFPPRLGDDAGESRIAVHADRAAHPAALGGGDREGRNDCARQKLTPEVLAGIVARRSGRMAGGDSRRDDRG